MFGGGAVTAWTLDQLRGLALRNILDAIRDGHGDYAKTKTRELLRLCQLSREPHQDTPQ